MTWLMRFFVVLVAIALVGCSAPRTDTGSLPPGSGAPTPPVDTGTPPETPKVYTAEETQVLDALKSMPQVQQYKDLPVEIKQLTVADMANEQYKAVYEGVPIGAYQVVYNPGGDGLLVIYDATGKRLLKSFQVKNLNI